MNEEFIMEARDKIYEFDPAELTEVFCKRKWEEIKNEWGRSSKKLKEWLNIYRPEYLDDTYTKIDNLYANVFLPYRKNKLWCGKEALSRLRLAIGTEVLIIFNNKNLNISFEEKKLIYSYQCLRLFCRINSCTVTGFTYKKFVKLLEDCYIEVSRDWEKSIEFFREKQDQFKPKYR